MYTVSHSHHPQYGNVVVIERTPDGDIQTPFFAWQQALTQRRLWREQGAKGVRFLVAGEIMSNTELEAWSYEEYKTLPKCSQCAQILGEEVHTHRLCGTQLFCSPMCADTNYDELMDRLEDEEYIDY